MTVTSATSQPPNANGTPSTSGNSSVSNGITAANFSSNLNDFLTLLTTQLTHQDPLAPMDSTQFTQQLVGFSQVEQQIQTNSNLSTLISLQQSGQGTNAVSYLGTVVEANGNSLPLVNGQAKFSYTLPSTAQSVKVTISDQNGNVINTVSGYANSGKNVVTWDGTDSNGNTVPDGVYSFQVSATDGTGKAVTPTSTTFFGLVTGVNGINGGGGSGSSGSGGTTPVTLNVDGLSIALSNVVSIQAPSASSAAK